MKSKFFSYAAVICSLICSSAVNSRGQDASVDFNDVGVSLSFRAKKYFQNSSNDVLDDNFNSQMYVRGDRIISRVVSDRESRLYFGYDLEVKFDSTTKKINFSVKPLSIKPVMTKQLKDLAAGSLSNYPKDLVVEDGDAVTLDILENPRRKMKIVDIIKIKVVNLNKNVPTKNGTENSVADVSQPAQDYSPEIFQTMRLTNVKIFVNGKQAANPGSFYGPFKIAYFSIPDKGRFLFSLSPHEGYDFQKIGVVEGNEISFSANGASYKLISNSPILAAAGSWNLWVLYDPDWRPDAKFSSFSPYWMGVATRVEELIKKN